MLQPLCAQEVEAKFGKYGTCKEARIVRNPQNGESRGFGFVAMKYEEVQALHCVPCCACYGALADRFKRVRAAVLGQHRALLCSGGKQTVLVNEELLITLHFHVGGSVEVRCPDVQQAGQSFEQLATLQ